MDATQGVTPHEVTMLRGHLGDLIEANQGVPTDQGGWGHDSAPRRACCILLVRPERVVVAVGLGDVAERIDPGRPVMRRHRMRLADLNAGAGARDAPVRALAPGGVA